jgi:hypothetical protein
VDSHGRFKPSSLWIRKGRIFKDRIKEFIKFIKSLSSALSDAKSEVDGMIESGATIEIDDLKEYCRDAKAALEKAEGALFDIEYEL